MSSSKAGSSVTGSIIDLILAIPKSIFDFTQTIFVQSITFVFSISLYVFNNILFLFEHFGSGSPNFFKRMRDLIFVLFLYAFIYQMGLACTLFPLTVVFIFRFVLRYKVTQVPLPPKILDDPTYGSHFDVTIKNIRLHYVSNENKTKPLLLFLHGFPDFWFSWREQIKHFSEDYWTVAVDMRGCGNSEKLSGIAPYHLDELIEDVKNLIQYLQRERCIIVAHDWGGLVLYALLLKYPELVEKYVALNIPPPYTAGMNPRQFIKSWYVYFFQLPILPELFIETADLIVFDRLYKKYGEEIVKAYKFTFSKPGALTYPLNYYRANLTILAKFGVFGVDKLSEKTNMPKGLAIYAGNDNYVDYKSFTRVTEVPNLRPKLLANEDHFMHQNNPTTINKLIYDFLEEETEEI